MAVNAGKLAASKTAEEKAARADADAVAKFLIEVFESPDPSRDGREITAAALLERAVKKLEGFMDGPVSENPQSCTLSIFKSTCVGRRWWSIRRGQGRG
jgi:hypothetical protein